MDSSLIPIELARRFSALREQRQTQQRERRQEKVNRQLLTPDQRQVVLAKTDNRCHVCGGLIRTRWDADHVLAHSGGGKHSVENYLPAHSLCNQYRWDYLPEEFQWILKIGVWARTKMELSSGVGRSLGAMMLKEFSKKEVGRQKRQKHGKRSCLDPTE